MTPVADVLRQHVQKLRRFAYALTGSLVDADDLVQDFVIKTMERGVPDRDDPVPWMLTTMKNLWLDQLRAAKVRHRHKEQEVHEAEIFRSAQESPVQVTFEVERVLQFLKQLPTEQRVVLAMVAIEGFSYKEAAEALEIPIGTVMSRLARARKQLLAMYED